MTMFNFSKASALSVLALVLTLGATPNSATAGPNPYVGEIVPMSILGFCPRGFLSTEGQLLNINGNDALFSLLGTMFGGDGRTTFGLPDLRGRVPYGVGAGPGLSNVTTGYISGNETATLNSANLAAHSHSVNVTNADGNKPGPGGKVLAAAPPSGLGSETIYSNKDATVLMSQDMIESTGQGQPFSTIDPTSVIRYCIATTGIYPSRS